MRTSIFALGALAGLASANINFSWVNPTCDVAQPNRCLSGQHCDDSQCVPDIRSDHSKVSTSHLRVVPEKRQSKYSQDGQCGPNNGNLLCDPNSTVYKGTCCSQYGWCGSTESHCGTGCLSGCSNSPAASAAAPVATKDSTVPARDDGRCGKDFGGASCDANGAYGGCCSSYGYCGSTVRRTTPYLHILQLTSCRTATASSPMAARTAARVPPPLLLPPLLLSPVLPLRPLVVNPSSESPPTTLSQLARRPPMEAAVPLSTTWSAAAGLRDLAALCTDTAVTQLPTAARAVSPVLASMRPLLPLLRPARLLLLPSPVPFRSRVALVSLLCTPV